jgi:hypothetical protein
VIEPFTISIGIRPQRGDEDNTGVTRIHRNLGFNCAREVQRLGENLFSAVKLDDFVGIYRIGMKSKNGTDHVDFLDIDVGGYVDLREAFCSAGEATWGSVSFELVWASLEGA